ncbi:type II toxin-antitoxin system YafQ family toxin [Candidatus Poriferisodalis sp.]|uniref:type II toxin-antitoxin system RelE/ParE family toxin n=1 Tax=Candidatus Poriferisodalis sp. TaxID=3101277 RepID=UPI003B020D5B
MILRTTNRFERDLKRAKRRGKHLDKLWAVLEVLLAGGERHARHRTHRLSGQWSEFRECHIEPDWLLIWDLQEDALVLVRTGTHSDLFG